MNYILSLCILGICLHASASEIPETSIEPQEVIVWNNVNFDILKEIASDLSDWCKDKSYKHCEIGNVSTFLSTDRTKVYYHISVWPVSDLEVIYTLYTDDQRKIASKTWTSTWNRHFTKLLPFNPGSK